MENAIFLFPESQHTKFLLSLAGIEILSSSSGQWQWKNVSALGEIANFLSTRLRFACLVMRISVGNFTSC